MQRSDPEVIGNKFLQLLKTNITLPRLLRAYPHLYKVCLFSKDTKQVREFSQFLTDEDDYL